MFKLGKMKLSQLVPLLLMVAYVLNVVVAKIQISSGESQIVRINDVGEFLLLFSATTTFVISILLAEKRNNK